MENPQSQEVFNIEKSPIRAAYRLLGAQTPLELSNLYGVEDQKIMKSWAWDYKNPDLITNQIKTILDSVDENTLTPDEKEWRQEILWFWYHHAISCAIWRYKDKETAQSYAESALHYQSEDHPNKITRLLSLLVNGKLEEAEEWAGKIEEEPEKTTAAGLIADYKKQPYF